MPLNFEGRIDNRLDLQRELNLPGPQDDASIFKVGYELFGVDFLKRIAGAFTAVIRDTRNSTIKLVRDPMALRPLYYKQGSDGLMVGSDVREIIQASKSPVTISEEKLLELFSPMYLIDEGWSDADSIMFADIRSIPFGSYVEQNENGNISVNRYWSPPTKISRRWNSPHECAMEFRDLFSKVIAEHLDVAGGIAAELSGGIDSGCNVSIAADMLKLGGREMHAYTATFGGQSSMEKDRIQAILRQYPNIKGHTINCDNQIDFLEGGELNKYRTTAYPARQNLPATFVTLARKAHANGAKILLSGEGADWFLEGSDIVWDSMLKSGSITEFRNAFCVLQKRSGFRKALRYVMKITLPTLLPRKAGRDAYLRAHYESTVNNDVPDIFSDTFRRRVTDTLKNQQQALRKRGNLSYWSQTLEHELMFPPNHVWQGVPIETELRLPYLDRRVVEFGLTVPPEYKFLIDEKNISHYGCRKFLQREAFRDVVPKEVIESQHKEVYGSPVNQRLLKHLPILCKGDMLLYEMGILDKAKFTAAVESFVQKPDDESHILIPWLDAVLATEKWLKATLEEFPNSRLPKF